jgi:HlyD family secretion protein
MNGNNNMKMKTKMIFGAAGLVMAVGAGCGFLGGGSRKGEAVAWRTAVVERGRVVQEVNASGAVKPVKQVEVGTQVNGPIQALHVDFNDSVTAGQLIAQIDPVVYEARVAQDEASLAANQANVKQAESGVVQSRATLVQMEAKLRLAEKELERFRQLAEAEMVSQADYDTALSNRDVLAAQRDLARAAIQQAESSVLQAQAAVANSEAALRLSRANLGYTTIRSPVDGVIVARNVDEGQTVVSSMNAQTIFLIATDLARIHLQADIPEADVGGIRPGQLATFTVDAYRQTFTGRVMQVRMSATTVQNVVTFPVIVEADNPARRLFPGMTANLAIQTGAEDRYLKVPAAAVRFSPEAAMPGLAGAAQAPRKPGTSTLWLLGAGGQPERVDILQKLSDGTSIAIEACEPGTVLEGREVILGVKTNGSQADKAVTNPFMPKMPGGNRRPPH